MKLQEFAHFGGHHWETACLKNMLAYQGLIAPHTNQPFSEAMILGIAGGITPGYSFCPSVLDDAGGIFIPGRSRLLSTSSTFATRFLHRLLIGSEVQETTSKVAALHHVKTALKSGKPIIAYCCKPSLPYLQLPMIYGAYKWMHTVVVHNLDEANGEVHLADVASTSLKISMQDFSEARSKIPSYKNRSLNVDAPKKLTLKQLKEAVLAGIEDYLALSNHPPMKTFSLEGLSQWAKLMTNDRNAKGWRRVYPGGKLFLALRDVFESIETLDTGGGLYRHLYADFLEEAATFSGLKSLQKVATHYRHLGNGWTEFAEACLPDQQKISKDTKASLRLRESEFRRGDEQGLEKVAKASKEIERLEKMVLKKGYPWGEKRTLELLESLSEQLKELIVMEKEALVALEKQWLDLSR